MNKMKYLIPVGIWIGLSSLFSACDTHYLAYEEAKDRAYFSRYAGVYTNYSTFPFWESGDRITVRQNFYVLGYPSTEEREVRLELLDSLTTAIEGEDYTLENHFIIPAGEIQATLPIITWKRRKDDDNRSDTLFVGLRIVENENFIPTMGDTVLLLYKKTAVTQPQFWAKTVFGPFSADLLYRFLDRYNSLKTSDPQVYNLIYAYAGEHWAINFYPNEVDFLILKYIMNPLYEYYQAHPTPGVMIPKPHYE